MEQEEGDKKAKEEGKVKNTLERLYGVLGIPGNEVLNVYLVGSRLFGVNKPGADYDLKVVIADDSSYAGPTDVQRGDGHGFEVDAHVYTLRAFLERVEEQDPQVLTCLFLPRTTGKKKVARLMAVNAQMNDDQANVADDHDEHDDGDDGGEEEEEPWVWKEVVPIEYYPRLIKLYRSVYHEADTNWSKAFRLWRRRDRLVAALTGSAQPGPIGSAGSVHLTGRIDDDDPRLLHYRAKKCIVHAIRFAYFGMQLAQYGSITDYKVANDLFYEILPEARARNNGQQSGDEARIESDDSLLTPAYYEAKYEPTLRSLIRKMKAYTEGEAKKAEEKAGDDPLPALLNQNVPSRRRSKPKASDSSQYEPVSEIRQLIEFLNQHEDGIRELSRNFGIKVKRSLAHPALYHLSYSDSSSPMACPLARACRALVLTKENAEWKVACYPFPKFYHYGPQQIFERGNRDTSRLLNLPKHVEGGPVEVTTQLKGVMVAMYWHEGRWLLNTLASPDASHSFSVRRGSAIADRKKFSLNPVSSMSLAEYFWLVWERKHKESQGRNYKLPVQQECEDVFGSDVAEYKMDEYDAIGAKSKCYVFELTSPHLQVVSITRPHQQQEIAIDQAEAESITLIAVRDLRTLDLLSDDEAEAHAAAYGWNCVERQRFSSFFEAVNAANALPFDGNYKGFVLQFKMASPRGGREVMVRLPSPTFIAYVNIKERPYEEEKALDPDAWEWHKEDYDFDSMNRLCMLEIVRWQYCTGRSSLSEEPDYLLHWGKEHQEAYLNVRRTFVEYSERLQAEFDQVIDGMLRIENSEKAEHINDSSINEAERRERLVRKSLKVMSPDEKRWFAQEVALGEQRRSSVKTSSPGSNQSEEEACPDPYRALLFEMKKEGCASTQEIMKRVHIKYLEELLFGVKNNKTILV